MQVLEYKHNGKIIQSDFSAKVEGKADLAKITIAKNDRPGNTRKYSIGDYAEYDSYNLSYYGLITKISPKTVTIVCRHDVKEWLLGHKVKQHRLNLHQFAWRNIDFNIGTAQRRNQDLYQII